MTQALPALRNDLQLETSASGLDGAPQWVLVDGITGRYFRITPDSVRLLRHWAKGEAQQVLDAANREPGLRLENRQLDQLLRFLRVNDLIAASDSQQRQSYNVKSRLQKTSLWQSLLHQYLFFRLPLWRPDPLLNRCWPALQRLGGPFLRFALPLILLLGLFLVSRDWARYTHAFPHLFTLPGMLTFGAALIVAKFIHELGHAFMAKRAGCRVQNMGVAFIVLFPLFYTDVTDAWKLKDHRQRLLIGAGGILAELILACVALLAWSFLPDGPVRTAAFMLSAVTWITTLMVNLNPLMRFDGYFLLSDFWRVENLQERAWALCRWRLREALFAWGQPAPQVWSPGMQRKLLLWGYASWIWRFLLFFGIAMVVYHFSIKVAGIALMLVEIGWFIALPVVKEMRQWWSLRHLAQQKRLWISVLLSVAVLLFLLFPWRGALRIPAVLEAENVTTFYAPVAAQVAHLRVTDGQQVHAGQVLLELSSADVDYRMAIARQQIALIQQQRQRGAGRLETASETQILDQQLAESLARYRGLQAQRQRLTITANHAGKVRDIAQDLTVGRWLSPDLPLLRIVNLHTGRLQGYLPEDALKRAHPGMEGIFIADDPARPHYPVRLTEIAPTAVTWLQQEMLASDRHGSIAIRRDREQKPVPVQAHYLVAMQLVQPDSLPIQPLRGTVILAGDRESIAGAWWRKLVALSIRESGF
ncbi:site-2 protease family protein [Pantoea allii]|uniref:site-2 protease family protein n=1 Tax=Pantoea allii TaxID=574096 RepID=UPI003D79A8C0